MAKQSTNYYVDTDIKDYIDGEQKRLNPHSEPSKPSRNNIAEEIFQLGIKEREKGLKKG